MSNAFMHQGDLVYRVEQLEKIILNRTSGRRLENSSIGAGGLRITDGGKLTVDGGELRLVASNGATVARWGNIQAGGTTSRGFDFNYSDGSTVNSLQGNPESQFWAVWDKSGNIVFSTDGQSGQGIGRPYLPYRMVPAFAAEGVGEGAVSLWPSTTSTSPVKLMQGLNAVQHPRVSIGVGTSTTGGGNVEWRLEVGGQLAASGTGAGAQTVGIPGWGDDIGFGDVVGLDLYAWCSGGATRAWIQCDRLYGCQS